MAIIRFRQIAQIKGGNFEGRTPAAMRIQTIALLSAVAFASVPSESGKSSLSPMLNKANDAGRSSRPVNVAKGSVTSTSGRGAFPRRQVPDPSAADGNIPIIYSPSRSGLPFSGHDNRSDNNPILPSRTRMSSSGHDNQHVSLHSPFVKTINANLKLPSPGCYPPPYPFLSNKQCEEIKAKYAAERRPLLHRIEELEAIKERVEVEEGELLDDLTTLMMSQEEEKLAVKEALGPIGELNDLLQELKNLRVTKMKQVDDISVAMKFTKFIESEEYHVMISKIEAFYSVHPDLRQIDTSIQPACERARIDSIEFLLQLKLFEQLEAERPSIKHASKMLVNLQKSQARLSGMLELSMKGTFIPVTNRNLIEDLRLVVKQMVLLIAEGELVNKIGEVKTYMLVIESKIANTADLEEAKELVQILGIYHDIYRSSLLLSIEYKAKKQQEHTGVKLASEPSVRPLGPPRVTQPRSDQQAKLLDIWDSLNAQLTSTKKGNEKK